MLGATQNLRKTKGHKIAKTKNQSHRPNKQNEHPTKLFVHVTSPTIPHSNVVHQFATNEIDNARRRATKACSKTVNTYMQARIRKKSNVHAKAHNKVQMRQNLE
jgi:DNA topoisomerase VI subunit B